MTDYSPFPVRRSSALPLVIAGAAFALATFLVLDRGGWLEGAVSADPRPIAPRGDLAALEQTFIDVFERRSPSVASIQTSAQVRTYLGVQEQQGTGSGFVWDEAGTVVTNNHVVATAKNVIVTAGGKNFRADVVATSPAHDLAVLRLRGNVQGLVPLPVGTSADLRVGQTAIAIGNPFGFDQTMTTGIVSALNRSIQTGDGSVLHGLIQIDAAINRGNSGGPLLDSAGRLIGITTAIYSPSGTSAGIGFAVPVDTVNEIVPRLIAGRPTTGALGVVRFREYPSYRFDPGFGHSSGAIVAECVEGSGAAAAGLRAFKIEETQRGATIVAYGDVIVEVDGRIVRTFDDLPRALANRRPGDVVELTVIRGLPDAPEEVELPVKLGEGVRSGM